MDVNNQSQMQRELAAIKGGESEPQTELPEGASPVEARAETPVGETASPPETPQTTEGEPNAEAAPAAEEEPIRIGGKTFKTQAEAFAYAEQVERDRELSDAHAAGIREALEATRQPVAPVVEEDNFEERFYANPKEALKEVQVRARDEALAAIKAEQNKEKLWTQFLTENPDIRRKDAERVLAENMDTIGKMTNMTEAMKKLAGKVRAEYEEIITAHKPRTVLPDKKQVTFPAGGAPRSVTPEKKDTAPLSFAEEMRTMRAQR